MTSNLILHFNYLLFVSANVKLPLHIAFRRVYPFFFLLTISIYCIFPSRYIISFINVSPCQWWMIIIRNDYKSACIVKILSMCFLIFKINVFFSLSISFHSNSPKKLLPADSGSLLLLHSPFTSRLKHSWFTPAFCLFAIFFSFLGYFNTGSFYRRGILLSYSESPKYLDMLQL